MEIVMHNDAKIKFEYQGEELIFDYKDILTKFQMRGLSHKSTNEDAGLQSAFMTKEVELLDHSGESIAKCKEVHLIVHIKNKSLALMTQDAFDILFSRDRPRYIYEGDI